MPDVLQTLPQDSVDFRKYTSNDPIQPNQVASPTAKSPSRKKKLLPIVILVFIVTVLVFGIFSTLVAYGKIPMANTQLKGMLTELVMALPFTPKTPEYLLGSAVAAHKQATTMYFDTSISIESEYLSSLLASGDDLLDFSVKGPVDYTDAKNPKSNIQIALGSVFNAEIVVLNDKLFFKLNAVPDSLVSFLHGIDKSKFLNKWLVTQSKSDTAPESELSDSEKLAQANLLIAMQNFMAQELAPRAKVSKETVDGIATNRIHLDVDKELYKAFLKALVEASPTDPTLASSNFEKEVGDSFGSGTIDAWFNAKSKYLYKAKVAATSKLPTPSVLGAVSNRSLAMTFEEPVTVPELPTQDITVTVTIKLEKVGEPITIEEPANAVKLEELLAELFESTPSASLLETTTLEAIPAESLFETSTSPFGEFVN